MEYEKMTKKELIQALGQRRVMFNALNDAVWILDQDQQIKESNRQGIDIFPYSEEEIIGKKCWEIAHCTDGPVPECPFVRMNKSLKRETMDLEMGNKWFQVAVDPIFSESGELTGAVHILSDITERIQAQNILKKSEERLIIAGKASYDLIYEWDVANDALKWFGDVDRILGLERGSISHTIEAWLDLIHPEDRSKLTNAVELHRTSTEPIEYEYRIRHQNGTYRYWKDHALPLLDKDGKPFKWVGVCSDITESREYEQALQESEEKYRELFNNSLMGIDIHNADGSIYSVNKKAEEVFGLSEDELKKKDLSFWKGKLINPDGKSMTPTDFPISVVAESKKPAEGNIIGLKMSENNEPSWFFHSARPVFDTNGEIEQVVTSFVDITEKKKAEDALRESERKYSSVVENSKEGIIIHTQGVIRYANRACIVMTGYLEGEIVGKNIMEFVAPEYREKVQKNFTDRMAGRKTPDMYEISIKKKDGSDLPLEISVSLLDYEGEISALVFLRDLSERRKAENEKARLQKQLLQSQKMEAVGNLAGGVAHDFNNLLTVIKGHVDLGLMNIEKDNPLHEDMQEIRNAADRAKDLTRQLLLYSRREHMDFEKCDINDIITSLLKMIKRLIGEDISIMTNLDPDLWTASVDRGNIEQVIMNLAVNSRDAMPDGGELRITCKNMVIDKSYVDEFPYAETGNYIRVSVEDTGCGMDEKTCSRIFEPFFTTKNMGEKKGTGLGMSVVYGIIKSHSGWINVISEKGKGTAFEIYLPAKKDRLEKEKREETSITDLRAEGCRILLVEDEETVKTTVARMLEQVGYTVVTAETATRAEELFKEEKGNFDLLFTDTILPDRSGLELISTIRKEEPDLKVLLGSGYTGDRVRRDVIKDHKYPFLQKPYEMGEMLETIKKIITSD